jgi:peroxiredoxin
LSAARPRTRLLLAAVLGVAVGAAAPVALWPPAAPPLRVGGQAPEFELEAADGSRRVALHELRGRVVFVNFWATWCPPCREEAPALERLYQGLAGEGFEILAISIDEAGSRDAVRAFGSEFGLSFPVLLDADRATYQAYQATGVPETFLVDRSGRVTERFVGPRSWDEARYAEAVRRLLAAPAGEGG